MNSERIADLEQQIAELKRRWPAHSAPPTLLEQLDELEAELKEELNKATDEKGSAKAAGPGEVWETPICSLHKFSYGTARPRNTRLPPCRLLNQRSSPTEIACGSISSGPVDLCSGHRPEDRDRRRGEGASLPPRYRTGQRRREAGVLRVRSTTMTWIVFDGTSSARDCMAARRSSQLLYSVGSFQYTASLNHRTR